jgi:hypothetical protein
MSKDSFLLLHDCERYKDIPLKKIDQTGSLVVYEKGDVDKDELIRITNKYKHDYS